MDAPPDGGSDLPDASTADGGEIGPPIPLGCADLTVCSTECPERCNARDDDCDGETDEGDDSTLCRAAHATMVCDRGSCLIAACAKTYRDCDNDAANGCEVAANDPNHCGGCENVCRLSNAAATCIDDKCVAAMCNPGYGDCDADKLSCEAQLASLDHCGACNVSCGGLTNATPQCDTGSCGLKTCLGNYGDCDANAANGCELRLDTLQDCGACQTACTKASCSGGACTAAQCTHPMADCNRDEVDCEVNILVSAANCGGCGKACAFQAGSPNAGLSCVNGSCVAACSGSFGDCDGDYANGCETALATTITHCGACATNCNTQIPHVATASCTSGACGIVSCAAGWTDCDSNPMNGCERNTAVEGPCFPDTNCVKQVNGTHEYYFCSNALSWSAARAKCQAQTRGDLVALSNATESSFVQSIRSSDAWIGARDAAVEGLWRWERSGVPFWRGNGSGSVQLGQYENWNGAQPDDSGGNEDCAEMLSDGSWADVDCAATHAFVCEVIPDECPSDAGKLEPGQCGCGTADTDADADGFATCNDACPSDANKQSPGLCGCGVSDANSDGDGVPNCTDGCPNDPTQTTACLTFAPTNFDPAPVNWSTTPITTLDCGTTTIDTTDPDGTGPLVATVSNWCGTGPTPIAQNQMNGPQAVVIPLRGFSLVTGNTLRLIGARPLILAIDGGATVDGTIDASASGTTPGAGGNWSCGTSQGGNGSGQTSRFDGASGGGGGGFGTAGGNAGTADTDGSDVQGGSAGATRGSTTLSPLFGGCAGGRGGDCSTVGGAGGGSVQITASGAIDVHGTIRVNGGAGATPCGGDDEGGGTGGGSGGAILLEGASVNTTGATIAANGGGGGANGQYAGVYDCGSQAGGSGSTSASSPGNAGGNCEGGSPGGGGGYGRILTVVR